MLTPKPTPIFDTYWRFAASRQEMFFARQHKATAPWTDDPILQRHKFTNAYRAADRVSQYLIRNVIYDNTANEEDVFFRTLLFKMFNKVETWELLESQLGPIRWRLFDFGACDSVLTEAMSSGTRIFSAAYIMPAGTGSSRKHRNYLDLLQHMMRDKLPARLTRARSLGEVFNQILAYPMMGEFLAFQYTIDLNYGPLLNFDENDFVVAGPGALSGISKCFSDTADLSPADLIRWVTDRQEREFDRLGLKFLDLWGRRLHLIDCQNLLCETNKYARAAHPEVVGCDGRTNIKQVFKHNNAPILFWFPPKWRINDRIPRRGVFE
ncbi:MAG: hypothetical protein HYU59_05710 [Magnetospirillum gryphiswaldense]|nr:hypothetical protein [Magnetospirillum gryphiswaldense]